MQILYQRGMLRTFFLSTIFCKIYTIWLCLFVLSHTVEMEFSNFFYTSLCIPILNLKPPYGPVWPRASLFAIHFVYHLYVNLYFNLKIVAVQFLTRRCLLIFLYILCWTFNPCYSQSTDTYALYKNFIKKLLQWKCCDQYVYFIFCYRMNCNTRTLLCLLYICFFRVVCYNLKFEMLTKLNNDDDFFIDDI